MGDIRTKRFWVVGKKGEIVRVYDNATDASLNGKEETPIFEFIPVNMSGVEISKMVFTKPNKDEEQKIVTNLAKRFYRRRDDYGCYGDVIQISRHRILENAVDRAYSYLYVVDSMMWRAFIKPGLAGDLVLFVSDRSNNTFLILIRRKKDPGAGRIAAPGGFLNIHKYEMETGICCALREAHEEIWASIVIAPGHTASINDPNADNVQANMFIAKKPIPINLKNLGIYVTEKKEEIKETRNNKFRFKRIYWTFVYTTLVHVDLDLDSSSAAELFTAADDALEVIAVPFEDIAGIDLGFAHHRTFIDDAVRYMKKNHLHK